MTGFSGLPVADEGADSDDVRWSGVARILGPKWLQLPALTIGLLGVQLMWSVEMAYGEPCASRSHGFGFWRCNSSVEETLGWTGVSEDVQFMQSPACRWQFHAFDRRLSSRGPNMLTSFIRFAVPDNSRTVQGLDCLTFSCWPDIRTYRPTSHWCAARCSTFIYALTLIVYVWG